MRRFLALILLVIFTCAIMPKQFFHEVFAGHQDTLPGKTDNHAHINKTGFNCDCNTIVATAPFTEHHDEEFILPLKEYKSFIPHFSLEIFLPTHSFFSLRGPPCHVSAFC
jgi:hypothetical protein